MDLQNLTERYIAAWNETDPTARRKLVEDAWATDGTYTDPLVATRGHDEFDSTLAAVQSQFPGLAFRLAGPVDAHHNVARFTWHLAPEGTDEPLVIGFDVLTATEDGRVASVVGFLDRVPQG
ncbi:nuclear transport factor 2 family protein [Kitasatospora sp. CB01950]|uniref:nuclear transport factor 2 family protein n=1 Tax=Kitasatospora sp. CB01950 TaxID=1703930 RepID=UPI00093C57A4|nr:nuclear transport factor 2 family protein [Kitasatospora sp. CB01950]OKJ08283.1 polyketide cyclase [Kitasatospora sp. CB01950]